MARFYGTIQGARGPASRLGHTNSGLTVTAQSYQGDIVVELHAEGDEDWVTICAREHGRGNIPVRLYHGPIAPLTNLEGNNFLIQQMAERNLKAEYDR